MKGEGNEHLDDSICCFAYCLDRWLHGVSRGWRPNSLIARIRRDLVDPSFCVGKTDSLSAVAFTDHGGGKTRDKGGNSDLCLILDMYEGE